MSANALTLGYLFFEILESIDIVIDSLMLINHFCKMHILLATPAQIAFGPFLGSLPALSDMCRVLRPVSSL